MQFTVAKSALCQALSLVMGAVAKKTTIPILANVKIEADGEQLTITGTDLENAMVVRIEAKVQEPGAVTLPAKKLSDYSRLLADGDVAFKVSDKAWATITQGRAKTRICGIEIAAFPEIPAAPDSVLMVPVAVLLRLISRVKLAIMAQESRFTLNGALIEHTDGKLRLVATDGHRLALASAALVGEQALSLLLPAGATRVLPHLSGNATEFEMSQDANHIFFRAGDALLVARKMAGNFPDYKRILPKDSTVVVKINRMELAKTLSRVAQFADERSRAIRISFQDGELVVHANSVDSGESTEGVACDYTGTLMEIGFNSDYITEFLAVVESEDVEFRLNDAKSAGELRVAGSEEYRYILMPMRI